MGQYRASKTRHTSSQMIVPFVLQPYCMRNLKIKLVLTIITIILYSCNKKADDRFVEINGKKQHILELGVGEPSVIFITGAGSKLTHYDYVQTEISKITKTFSYDKPGLGKSEMINTPRTVENLTAELAEILRKEKIKEPFILVGHSLGGYIARYFLHEYPEKVVGIVLIDPGDENLVNILLSSKSEKERKFLDSLINAPDPTTSIGKQMERKSFHQHDSLMKTLNTETQIPITLIESNKVAKEDLLEVEVIQIQKELYRNFQKRYPQTKIISTEKSGHFIQLEEPQLVIDAIKSVLNEVKGNQD